MLPAALGIRPSIARFLEWKGQKQKWIVKKPKKDLRWSEEELALLCKNIYKSNLEINKLFPYRTFQSVKSKTNRIRKSLR